MQLGQSGGKLALAGITLGEAPAGITHHFAALLVMTQKSALGENFYCTIAEVMCFK